MIERERHLYYFTCKKCKHKATTLKKNRANIGLCRKCRSLKIPENQMSFL